MFLNFKMFCRCALFSEWNELIFLQSVLSCSNFLSVPFKQNEENKKKNKQAALKAQMDLEEARQATSSQAEQQQKNNNASRQDQEGETFEF